MALLAGTLVLRPYVFAFVACFLAAGCADLGWRRTLLFGGLVWAGGRVPGVSWAPTGVPFGLYHYTGATRGQELYLADVPLMDSLSFTFLAYAGFALARGGLARPRPARPRPAPRAPPGAARGPESRYTTRCWRSTSP